MKLFVALLLSIFIQQAQAASDRSVSIAAENGKITLINGSTVAVSYTAECYDRTTGNNILTGASNVTLAPKGDISYEASGACAGGATPAYKSPQNIVACSGSANYAGASALCGTASNLCTIADLITRGVSSLSGYPTYYWFSAGAGVNPLYTTWDNWGKSSPYPTSGGGKNYQPRSETKNVNYRCNTTNSVGTGGSGIGNCNPSDVNISASGALCCPTNNGFKSCKVTILSSTPAAGHLQSPQFKGGASF